MRTEIKTNKQKQNKNFFIERYFRYWQWSFQMIQKIKEYAKYLWKVFLNSKQMVGMGCVCLTAATLWSNKGIRDNCLIYWWVWMAEICLHSMWHYFMGRKIYKSCEEEEYKQTVQREKYDTIFPWCHRIMQLLICQLITMATVLRLRYRYRYRYKY